MYCRRFHCKTHRGLKMNDKRVRVIRADEKARGCPFSSSEFEEGSWLLWSFSVSFKVEITLQGLWRDSYQLLRSVTSRILRPKSTKALTKLLCNKLHATTFQWTSKNSIQAPNLELDNTNGDGFLKKACWTQGWTNNQRNRKRCKITTNNSYIEMLLLPLICLSPGVHCLIMCVKFKHQQHQINK